MANERTLPLSSWLDRPLLGSHKLTWEHAVLALILLAAFVTRFHMLGERVMSHDETTHVYFSWQLFKGQGYQHHPLSHGPLQFHLLALSYFLFGDNDLTARAPQALFGVAVVFFVWWAFRRYLGRTGALLAAGFYLISPYLMYYSRYARNEIFVALFGLVMLWAILRYLDTGEHKYVYIGVAAIALHFTSKETSFIYVAQALVFLGLVFLWRIAARSWTSPQIRRVFFITLLLSVSLFFLAIGAQIRSSELGPAAPSATQVEEPVVAATEGATSELSTPLAPTTLILGALGAAALLTALTALLRGYGLARLRQERAFVLMGILFALVLPHLSAFPIRWLHHDPMAYQDASNLWFIGGVVAVCALLSAGLGVAINGRVWLISSAVFYAIFVPFYTTIFSNGVGFFSGLVGSLGYWLEQQAVERGNQPSYYYWAVQIPAYEYLAAAGSALAALMGIRSLRRGLPSPAGDTEQRDLLPYESCRMALVLLAFWSVSALAAYTIAGEKMPWLTVHIAMPMLLLAGWAVSRLIARVDWAGFAARQGWLLLAGLLISLGSAFSLLGALLGQNPPFQGNELAQLQATTRFLLFVISLAVGIYALLRSSLAGEWPRRQLSKLSLLLVFGALALLTLRTALRANFRNYDLANEYLVYAHMAPGSKIAMQQIEEISRRITGGLDLQVAYDNETSYPFWWYLRNYPNQRFYGGEPTRDLRQFPVIIVGDTNYGKLEPIVGQSFYKFEYMRIWWPNQDYFDFTPSSIGYRFTSDTGQPASEMSHGEYLRRVALRLWDYVGTPSGRADLWQIWLNSDFTSYLANKGQSTSLQTWSPGRTMRVYIRKDVAAQIWEYGVAAAGSDLQDPYEGKGRELAPQFTVGGFGSEPGQFISPRNAAMAPDGSVYVADSGNHRIQHLAADGRVLQVWGSYADLATGEAPGGTFNEPWSLALSPDGAYVYVADTWNHRVQQFSADGRFVRMWGYFGQDESAGALWGPRDITVLPDGNVLVTDTGNKRLRMYTANGEHLSDYGEYGFEPGQFDEPVGVAYDAYTGRVFVADTWNQRVQVLDYRDGRFLPSDTWEIAGWYGQSLTNKPYLSPGKDGALYIADPEAGRVLVYGLDGTLQYFFGGFDQSAANIAIAQGVAADPNGGVWVVDSQNATLSWFATE